MHELRRAGAGANNLLAGWLPAPVVAVVRPQADTMPFLYPEEAAQIRRAVPKRRAEFALGRACARAALRRLGVAPGPILSGPHREPLWPAGIVGSISHSPTFCLAAVARRTVVTALGIDIEPVTTLTQEQLRLICTPDERAWLADAPEAERPRLGTLLFSAKESVFKALFPQLGRYFDFQDMTIHPDPEQGVFKATPTGWAGFDLPAIEGRHATREAHVCTVASFVA